MYPFPVKEVAQTVQSVRMNCGVIASRSIHTHVGAVVVAVELDDVDVTEAASLSDHGAGLFGDDRIEWRLRIDCERRRTVVHL